MSQSCAAASFLPMVDESSDILGAPTTKAPPAARTSIWQSISKSLLLLLSVYAGLVVLRLARDAFLRWQERGSRLATRRRHGIPDNDHRPFTVAHAAAQRARQEQDRPKQPPPPEILDLTNSPIAPPRQPRPTSRVRPQTHPSTSQRSTAVNPFREQSASLNLPGALPIDPLNFAERYNPNTPVSRIITQNDPVPPTKLYRSSQRLSIKPLNATANINEDSKKRSLDDDGDSEPVKKTRVEGEELIDGDEDAGWYSENKDRDEEPKKWPQRGSKRHLRDDDTETKRTREKRRRQHLGDRSSKERQVANSDDSDEGPRPRSFSRGKKRDRAEAGSSFDGDNEQMTTESEGEAEKRVRQRAKRRTLAKRMSEVNSRGQKRDRSANSSESEEDEEDGLPTSRKKRGKTLSEDEGYQGSDVSMDATEVSQDPLCKGRLIGEEWEVNGVTFKVGPNGDRLRQSLVRKSRSKFIMPKDSQHPDKQANLDVYVEAWLNEDDYQHAKGSQQLAWQDSPKSPTESEPPADVPETPTKAGKDLLWSAKQKDGVIRRPFFNQSIATNVGVRVNPFQQSPSSTGRRVASALASDATGSPKKAYRSFSKWEKQDLEAEAMAKLRVQKKAVTPDKKLSGSGGLAFISAPSTSAAASTPISVPKSEKPTQEIKPASTLSFDVPPTTTSTTKEKEPNKPAIAAPSFGFPSSFTSQPQAPAPTGGPSLTSLPPPPSSTAPGVPAIPTVTITPPSAKLLPTPTPAASTNPMPNLTVPGPYAPAPSISASSTGSVPPPASSAAKVPAFTFNVPPPSTSTTSTGSPFSFPPQPSKAPTSAFGPPSSNLSKKAEPPAGGGAVSGPSLMNRIGSYGHAQTSQPTVTGSPSPFMASKPATAELPSRPQFNAPTPPTRPPPAPAPAPAPAAGNTGFKFDFGFTKKTPGASGDAAQGTATAQSPASKPSAAAFGSEPAKLGETTKAATTTTFGFGAAKPTEISKPPEAPANTVPQFGFPSSSGSTPVAPSGGPAAPLTQSSSAPPAPTSVFGENSGSGTAPSTASAFGSAGNIFGGAGSGSITTASSQPDQKTTVSFGNPPKPPATTSTFPFGGSPAANPGGTTSTFPFGTPTTLTTKPADSQSSGFPFGNVGSAKTAPTSFGNTGSSLASKPAESSPGFGLKTTTSGTDAPKPVFSFSSHQTPAGEQPKAGFSILGAAAAANAAAPQSSAFGAQPPTQSAFGTPSSNSATTQHAFGTPSPNKTTAQPAFGTPPSSNTIVQRAFTAQPGFGSPSSNNTTAHSAFGTPSSNKTTVPAFGTPSSSSTAQPPFGMPSSNNATSQPVFGTPSFNTTSQPAFAANNASTQPVFGKTGFGAPTASAFGFNSTPSNSSAPGPGFGAFSGWNGQQQQKRS